jgi:putative transposase
MYRAHKIRLNPTPEQEAYLLKACGTARFCFNWGLAEIKRALKEGKKPEHWRDLRTRFNAIKGDQYPWVYEVTFFAISTGFENLEAALINYWNSKNGKYKGKRVGFPKFKSRKHKIGGIRIPKDGCKVNGYTFYVPRLGWVNMTQTLRFQGDIAYATISHQSGWWWVSIVIDVPYVPINRRNLTIGVDVGIKNLVVTSDGQCFPNKGYLKTVGQKIKKLQRILSRKIPGSNNYYKAKAKLTKANYRLKCLRSDNIHKITTKIAKKATVIGIETLNVNAMLRNHKLARSLSDASLSEIHRQLIYKAEWYGGEVVRIDKFFPSSKTHARCGGYNNKLTLSDRKWTCPKCGKEVDRDWNASRNIRDEAIRLKAFGSGLAPECRPVDVM